jgi:hypothetical protein
MRFTVISSITLLAATLASGLVIPADIESGELVARSEFIEDVVDAVLERRSPRSSNAKKAKIAAAKPVKAAAKAANKQKYAKAAKAHKATTNLPARNSVFKVRGGNGKPAQKWSGKEVRKAVFKGHVEAQRVKGLSKTQAKKTSKVKPFSNRKHEVPKPGSGARPLNHMKVDPSGKTKGKGPGREAPLKNKAKATHPGPGPARVITQQTKKGHHTFKGVISHDQSRKPGTPGYNDHFKVKENKVKPPRRK